MTWLFSVVKRASCTSDNGLPATRLSHISLTTSKFAVVERRAGRIYPTTPGEREGEPMTTEGMAKGDGGRGCHARDRESLRGRGTAPRSMSPAGSSHCRRG